jgi:hypothetical protein
MFIFQIKNKKGIIFNPLSTSFSRHHAFQMPTTQTASEATEFTINESQQFVFTAFASVTLFFSVELIILCFATFKRYQGAYFWSLLGLPSLHSNALPAVLPLADEANLGALFGSVVLWGNACG